jgi:hypothetical protein
LHRCRRRSLPRTLDTFGEPPPNMWQLTRSPSPPGP